MHHSTVSRALRDDARVNEKTRKKVLEYATEHGYQINMSALQLRGSVRNAVAVIVPNINHNFFSNVVSIVTDLASKEGYLVSVFQSNESFEQEKKIIDTVIQNNVAGVIASVAMETTSPEHFRKLKKYNIPLVLFDRVLDNINVSKVMVNNREVVEDAVDLLVKQGCSRIAHISGPQQVNVFSDRHEGYLEAIRRNKLEYCQKVIINSRFTIEDGEKAIDDLFGRNVKPDGIICDSNILQIGILIALKKKGINIPADIKLVSFSDNPYIEVFTPEIICIKQPDKLVAEKTIRLLLKNIDDEDNLTTESIMVSATIDN